MFFITKSIMCATFLGDPSSIIHACFSDICLISFGFWNISDNGVLIRQHMQNLGSFMVCVASCSVTDLFRFDVLRCREDVRVRGAFKDPVQCFQLLLGEGICPKVFP